MIDNHLSGRYYFVISLRQSEFQPIRIRRYYTWIHSNAIAGPYLVEELVDLVGSGKAFAHTPVVEASGYNEAKPWLNRWIQLREIASTESGRRLFIHGDDALHQFSCEACAKPLTVRLQRIGLFRCPHCNTMHKISERQTAPHSYDVTVIEEQRPCAGDDNHGRETSVGVFPLTGSDGPGRNLGKTTNRPGVLTGKRTGRHNSRRSQTCSIARRAISAVKTYTLHVQYKDGRFDYLNAATLDRFLSKGRISRFFRPSEEAWVTVGIDPIRGDGRPETMYTGNERRSSQW